MDVSPLLGFRLDMWIPPAPTQRSFKPIGRCCPGGGAWVSSSFSSTAAQGAGSAASSFASAAAVAAAAAATCRCAFGGGGVGGGEEGGGGGWRTQRCSRSGAAAQIAPFHLCSPSTNDVGSEHASGRCTFIRGLLKITAFSHFAHIQNDTAESLLVLWSLRFLKKAFYILLFVS
ncbi:PREDICTED: dual specificity protein phosphatase 8-like [Hipposideros armiger]|uniref:Dual specificity protein phosphatase 8-like n=1 Tax=Hipposideros armiger TaxID=186990 RepID=A0A8B7PWP1_HIPAR|nr:PREDICTED: dual specificity protein phosphatase 8-like [Hipposideros armiger]